MIEDDEPSTAESDAERLRAVLIEIGQPAPLPVGCTCWAEVASHYEEDLQRRVELARAALPDALRPLERPLYRIEVKWE